MPSALWTVLGILVLFFFARYFGGMGIGAPWLPVRKRDIKAAFDLVEIGAHDVVIDLGSGDGRLLIAAAEKGAQVIGYELNPILCAVSQLRLKRHGARYAVYRKDLLDADLSKATVIFFFGIHELMPRVAEKLKKEARHDAKIISFAFELPGLVEVKKEGIARLYRLTS
jgi:SAM-dependent methyltransferase